MKKMFVIVSLFVIFFSGGKTDFSLLDYFDGEYIAYSRVPLSKNCINLGTCYMNAGKVNGAIIGESLTIRDLEISAAIDTLDATIIKTEVLVDGTIVIYAYTERISSSVKLNEHKVNIQIAERDEYSVIGWPLILGSF